MSMGNCRICFQYRDVDKSDRICQRCKIHEDHVIPGKIRLAHHKGKIRLENVPSGNVLSKEDWFYIKRHVDSFYNSVSSDDIEWMNKERSKERDKEQRLVSGHIYLLQASNGCYKIGRTIDLDSRLKQHERDYPLEIKVIHSFWCRNNIKAESHLLKMFSEKKLQGEWFELEPDDVKFITGITDEIAKTLF